MFTNTTVNSSVLPAMAVRGIVPLPNNEIRLEVGRKESILALKEAASSNKYIALFVQKNPNVEKPTQEDVYKEGLVVKILYDMETANIHKVKVLGIVRCDSLEVIQTEPYWLVNIVTKPIVNDEVETELAHVRLLIKEIENNLTNEIDVNKLAQKAAMSVYEFRRIFSFISKISFGEYIRKRRLSLAALELHQTKCNITEISLKYGYNSPSSFTRAFKEFHGISPAEVITGNSNFRLITKISTEIITKGGNDITYSIFEKDSFAVSGLLCKSTITDTECCEDAWEEFYNSEIFHKLRFLYFFNYICTNSIISKFFKQIYFIYNNSIFIR